MHDKTLIISIGFDAVSALQLQDSLAYVFSLKFLPSKTPWRHNFSVRAVYRPAFMFSLQTPVHTYRGADNIPLRST